MKNTFTFFAFYVKIYILQQERSTMKYQNPILRGFYPDQAYVQQMAAIIWCAAVFSTFREFLFESKDLVNWNQIGYVLTRKSQVMLHEINSSGGVLHQLSDFSMADSIWSQQMIQLTRTFMFIQIIFIANGQNPFMLIRRHRPIISF